MGGGMSFTYILRLPEAIDLVEVVRRVEEKIQFVDFADGFDPLVIGTARFGVEYYCSSSRRYQNAEDELEKEVGELFHKTDISQLARALDSARKVIELGLANKNEQSAFNRAVGVFLGVAPDYMDLAPEILLALLVTVMRYNPLTQFDRILVRLQDLEFIMRR